MSNVTPTVPPAAPASSTTTVTASPGSAEDPSHQQQEAGTKQGGSQAPQQAAPTPAAPAVTLAASVVGLREGMRFKGTMMGSDASGQPVIKTPNGTFVLENAAGLLSLNGDVELEIRGTGNQIRALILAIAGKPQHPPKELKLTLTGVGAEAAGNRAGGTPPIASAGPAPRGFPQPGLTIGTQLSATVQSLLTPNSPALLPGGAALSPGATLILKLVDIATPSAGSTLATAAGDGLADEVKARLAAGNQALPGGTTRAGISGNPARLAGVTAPPGGATPAPTTATATPAATPAPTTPAPAAPATTAPSAASTATATQPAPPTTSAAAGSGPAPTGAAPPATAATPSGAPAAETTATPPPSGTAARLSGEVISRDEAGRMLVRTPVGDLALTTRAILPPGTRLEFETVALRAPEAPTAPSLSALAAGAGGATAPGTLAEEAAAAVRAFGHEWPALKEALTLLQSVNPALAQQVVSTLVPSANSALANSILVFLAAIRGGDVRGWLGAQASQSLESGGGSDLLNRLSSEMAQMGRAADALTSGDWRALPFPFFDGANLQQVWAFVREHRRAADQEGQRALRFIVELDLSKLGGIQLDGLIQDNLFNLMIRSVGTLPDNVRQDIAQLFDNSLEATGYTGSVLFDPASIYPISPLREARQGAAPGGEITA